MNDSSPGWFGRNWKWFVPVGCLTVLLFAVAVGSIIAFGIHNAYEASGAGVPAQEALAAARTHPAVTQALGQPVKLGASFSGKLEVGTSGGSVDMHYRLSGPRGKGEVHVVGSKMQGRWHYDVLQARIDGQPTPIDLRPMLPVPEAAAPPAD